MITLSNLHSDTYRLALIKPAERMLLADLADRAPHLPRVSIPRWTRPAEEVQIAIREKWGYDAVIVDFLAERGEENKLVVAELRSSPDSTSVPGKHAWLDLDQFASDEPPDSERRLLGTLLKDRTTHLGPFSRLGWMDEALDWVTELTATDQLKLSGEIKQFNANAHTALVRFGRVDAPPVWLKGVANQYRVEYRITTGLAGLIPQHLPPIIAAREDWSAWTMHDAGTPLNRLRSRDVFGHATLSLGQLQSESVGRTQALLALGCADRRTALLRARIPELMNHFELAMAQETANFALRLDVQRIRELGSNLEEACFAMEDLGIPDALIHGDIHFGNILSGPYGCVFTDWADASVGNPFINFENLRVQLIQEQRTRAWLPWLIGLYRRSWRPILTDSQFQRALDLVPAIAIAQHLCRKWTSLSSTCFCEPRFHGYIRALARQLDRAITDGFPREAACA